MLPSDDVDILHHFTCRGLKDRWYVGKVDSDEFIQRKCWWTHSAATTERYHKNVKVVLRISKGRLKLFLHKSNIKKLSYDSGQHVDPQAQVAASDRFFFRGRRLVEGVESAQLTRKHGKFLIV